MPKRMELVRKEEKERCERTQEESGGWTKEGNRGPKERRPRKEDSMTVEGQMRQTSDLRENIPLGQRISGHDYRYKVCKTNEH